MTTTRVAEINFQGDPHDIKPRNRRERRVKAKLLRLQAMPGLARAPGSTTRHKESKGYVGKKL